MSYSAHSIFSFTAQITKETASNGSMENMMNEINIRERPSLCTASFASFSLFLSKHICISFYEKVSGLGMECSQAINIHNAFMLCALSNTCTYIQRDINIRIHTYTRTHAHTKMNTNALKYTSKKIYTRRYML